MNQEELMAHIAQLTENQRNLVEELAALRARPVIDPFTYYKTPDPIKNLSTFAGNKRETIAWIQEADDALDLFVDSINEPIYAQLVKAVKSKIVGDAKETLIAAGNPSDWAEIKNTLLNSYGDKRDLTSHIQSMFYITQDKSTLVEYFKRIKQVDTAIKSTANAMEEFRGATRQINAFVSLMSTTRYIDGLGETLSMIVRSHKPDSLEEAYTIATQYSNAAYRQKLDKNNQKYNTFKPSNTYDNNRNTFANNSQNSNNPSTSGTSNNSARFRQRPQSGKFRGKPSDDDVSMKSNTPRMQINTQEQEIPNQEIEEKINELNSDDDDYFISDELNFQLGIERDPQT